MYMDKPIVFILFGKPGSGKESARTILLEHIKRTYGKTAFFSDSGLLFRLTINQEGCVPSLNDFHLKRVTEIQSSGALQTSALATLMWMNHFTQHYNGEQFIIMDGSPRREPEVLTFLQHFREFYNAEIQIMHIDVTDEVAIERMVARQQKNPERIETQTPEALQKRMQDFREKNLSAFTNMTKFYEVKTVYTIDNNGSLDALEKQITAIKFV